MSKLTYVDVKDLDELKGSNFDEEDIVCVESYVQEFRIWYWDYSDEHVEVEYDSEEDADVVGNVAPPKTVFLLCPKCGCTLSNENGLSYCGNGRCPLRKIKYRTKVTFTRA